MFLTKTVLRLRHTGPKHIVTQDLEYDEKSWACNNLSETKCKKNGDSDSEEWNCKMEKLWIDCKESDQQYMYFGEITNTDRNKQTTWHSYIMLHSWTIPSPCLPTKKREQHSTHETCSSWQSSASTRNWMKFAFTSVRCFAGTSSNQCQFKYRCWTIACGFY